MYSIDLQTILRVLANQSGELRTTVKQVADLKRDCQACVSLSFGKVVACVITYNGEPVLMGEEAFQMLMHKGILEWEYLPAPPTVSLPPSSMMPISPSSSPPLLPPQRTQLPPSWQPTPRVFPVQAYEIPREQLGNWPRQYRFVYQLSTGEKTVEEIARLLSLPPEYIDTILQTLVREGFIFLRRY